MPHAKAHVPEVILFFFWCEIFQTDNRNGSQMWKCFSNWYYYNKL